MSYFKPNIDAMTAYVPGIQPGPGTIKLNANENPYPPSPKAWEAFAHVSDEELRVYPDPAAKVFTAVVSEILGVPQSRILAGNGSDNVLAAIIHAAGGPIAIPSPTFPYYQTLADVEGATIIEVDTNERFNVDFDALAKVQAAVTFLANPNNPTGVAATVEQIDALAGQLGGLLIVDEAYCDFTDITALPLVDKHPNLIVTRTLSKGYSLASLRLGFAVAQESLIASLFKAMEIYNLSTPTIKAGAAAYADQDHKNANAAKILASRNALATELASREWDVIPSEANFLLAAPPERNGEAVYEQLKAKGIFVRYFKQPRLADYLRITIGTDEQNKTLLAAL